MGQFRSTEPRCAELDRLALELVKAYGRLDEEQILSLRQSLSSAKDHEQTDHPVTIIHQQIAAHRVSCERCIEIIRTYC